MDHQEEQVTFVICSFYYIVQAELRTLGQWRVVAACGGERVGHPFFRRSRSDSPEFESPMDHQIKTAPEWVLFLFGDPSRSSEPFCFGKKVR